MSTRRSRERTWLHGFTTGIAACGLALLLRRKMHDRRPRLIDEEGTVIPIE